MRMLIGLAVTLGALVASGPALGATVDVSTAQQLVAAVGDAHSGELIRLAPGNYPVAKSLDVRTDLAIEGPSSAPGATVSGTAIDSPSAISGQTDLLAVASGAHLTVTDLTLTEALGDGSAVDLLGARGTSAGASLTLERVLLSDNSGLAVDVQGGASMTATNTTFSDNLADAIVADGSLDLESDTVAYNALTGINNRGGGKVSLRNTIVAGNGSASTSTSDCTFPVERFGGSSGTSLDDDGTCGANLTADPLLGQLTPQNGGPTSTRALLPGSPAIGAGAGCPSLDQRSAPRTGACDLGAYQSGSSAPPAGTGGGGGSGPTSGSGTHKEKLNARVMAHGFLLVRRRRVSFRIEFATPKHHALVAFSDPRARVRIRTTSMPTVHVSSNHRSATLHGRARNLHTGRRLVYTILLSRGAKPRISVRLASGYAVRGAVHGGVSITA